MKANDVIELLRVKHAKDVFFAEAKTGESWGTGCLRIDAWAMKKSWAKRHTFVYEVKVSRADWLADQKFREYEPYGNLRFIVAPKGVVKPDDQIPSGWGHLEVAKTGRTLRTIRKAALADIEGVPEDLYRYLLMYRVTPERPTTDAKERTVVSGEEHHRTVLALSKAEIRVSEMENEIKGAAGVREALKALGMPHEAERISSWVGQSVRRRIQALRSAETPALKRSVERAVFELTAFRSSLAKALKDPN